MLVTALVFLAFTSRPVGAALALALAGALKIYPVVLAPLFAWRRGRVLWAAVFVLGLFLLLLGIPMVAMGWDNTLDFYRWLDWIRERTVPGLVENPKSQYMPHVVARWVGLPGDTQVPVEWVWTARVAAAASAAWGPPTSGGDADDEFPAPGRTRVLGKKGSLEPARPAAQKQRSADTAYEVLSSLNRAQQLRSERKNKLQQATSRDAARSSRYAELDRADALEEQDGTRDASNEAHALDLRELRELRALGAVTGRADALADRAAFAVVAPGEPVARMTHRYAYVNAQSGRAETPQDWPAIAEAITNYESEVEIEAGAGDG